MFVECGGNDVERMKTGFFDLVVPSRHGQTGGILDCVF